ncbi:MAG: hypothetical protein LBV34_00020 [Nocardiopsaceae bacterium]|jgi:hypothetical protein|nr:hypothetical protein [Nocardiopsaceae bacterium]
MASPVRVIVELARDGAVDRYLRAEPPPSLASDQVVLDRIEADPPGGIGPPEAGQVVLSVLSPEGLRDAQQVREVVAQAEVGDEPLTIVVEAAEYLREDELAVVLDAGRRADRLVVLRIMADA